MKVYLDNSGTTKAYDEVGDLVRKVLCEDFGNPSSMHYRGVESEQYIKEAKDTLAKILKVQQKEIFFTSGGTESDNLALIGTAMANRRAGNHLITTGIEHPAIINTMRYLEEEGFRVTFLPVDRYGRISLDALKDALCEDTILVSVMYVNNEVGSVQPIQEAASMVKAYNKNILFHVDAVQGFGKYHIYPKRLKVDMCSISGHKIHGPKGIGFLYIKEGTKISPIIFGGGQQKGMRSGTENVPGIVGLAVACEKMIGKNYENAEKIREVKEYFQERIKEIEDIKDNSGKAPHVASISFKKLRSEVLLHALEDREIYVSSGSACSSNKKQAVSGTLNAIALSDEFKDGTLRFSFSIENTKEEVDETIKALKELVPMLRRFVRK